MSIVINAKGTSVPSFTIGKSGITLYHGNVDPTLSNTIRNNDYWFDGADNSLRVWTGSAWVRPTNTGSVNSVSIVSTHGFSGSVASTITPAITLNTTVNGMIKGDATSLLGAIQGFDYSVGTSALATGIIKSTTATGVLSIAIPADFPTLNQNTTGSAAKLTTARTINTVSFDGTANIVVTAAAGTLTGTALNTTVVSSSLTSVGTIAAGVWNGTTIDIAHGGTGQVTKAPAFNALSPLTTKGDIIVFDGTNNVRQAVGANNSVLVTDSAQTNGVKWQPAVVIKSLTTGVFAQTSGTTTIPKDNTVPLITEGTQIMTATITPQSTASRFIFNIALMVDCSNTGADVVFALFRNSVFIGVVSVQTGDGGLLPSAPSGYTVALVTTDSPASAVAITYSARIGTSAGTWYAARLAGATFGGTTGNGWTIMEV